MRLVIRDIVKRNQDELLLDKAGYTFYQGKVYGISGKEKSRRALMACIAFEDRYDSGSMELICAGRNCMAPAMVVRFPEEPAFPEFLTVREFLKYYIDINRRNIAESKTIDEYLAYVELEHVRSDRMLKDFTWEERMRLEFLCLLITAPPVLLIDNLRSISNVDFLKDIKRYIDRLKESSIILLESTNNAVTVFLCDEELTINNGCIQGGV